MTAQFSNVEAFGPYEAWTLIPHVADLAVHLEPLECLGWLSL